MTDKILYVIERVVIALLIMFLIPMIVVLVVEMWAIFISSIMEMPQ